MTADEALQIARLRKQWPIERCLAARENARLSLRTVANHIGVSAASVHHWENGSNPRDPNHEIAYYKLMSQCEKAV